MAFCLFVFLSVTLYQNNSLYNANPQRDENITWPYFGVIPNLLIYYLIARRLF